MGQAKDPSAPFSRRAAVGSCDLRRFAPQAVGVGQADGSALRDRIPGIRQVRKGRVRGVLGELSHEHLTMLDECLDAYLR